MLILERQRWKYALRIALQDRKAAAEKMAAAEKARLAAEEACRAAKKACLAAKNNADALATQSKVSHTLYLC